MRYNCYISIKLLKIKKIKRNTCVTQLLHALQGVTPCYAMCYVFKTLKYNYIIP